MLARAFYDDPVTSWMLPDDRTRLKALTRAFSGLARHHFLPRGGSEVGWRDGDVGAATLWDPPGQRKSLTARGAAHGARHAVVVAVSGSGKHAVAGAHGRNTIRKSRTGT